jgi:hypothetical protein
VTSAILSQIRSHTTTTTIFLSSVLLFFLHFSSNGLNPWCRVLVQRLSRNPPLPLLYYIVLHVNIQFVPHTGAAEIVRDLKIVITRFSTRVLSRTGVRTKAVTFEDTHHGALGS